MRTRTRAVAAAVLAVVALAGCGDDAATVADDASTTTTPSTTSAGPTTTEGAADGRVVSFDSAITVGLDGGVAVTEVITYDFGAGERHGIERTIPTEYAADENTAPESRPLSDVSVSASDGTPDDLMTSDEDGSTTLRIGDPDRTISGQHTYTIHYRIDDAVDHVNGEAMLTFAITGDEWSVPIDEASAVVTAPVAVTGASCVAGPPDTIAPCQTHQVDGPEATFEQDRLEPGSGLTALLIFGPGL